MNRLTIAATLLCLLVPSLYTSEAAATGLVYCAADQTYRQTCGQANSRIQSHSTASGGGVIGGRPAGCPRKFCGCEASLYVFGVIKPELNLASNWPRYFPRTVPSPGKVAARPGHVFVLIRHVEGDRWLVHDGNSGGGYTRQHVRSITGFAVVDPLGSRVASK